MSDRAKAFFTDIWPIYPFVDRIRFQELMNHPNFHDMPQHDPAFAALYYTMISLGVLSRDGGSFEPMEGPAWRIFALLMRSFNRILFSKKSLVLAQVCAL